MSEPHDLIVCGAGSAGAALAWMAASRGLRVLVLERRTLDRAGASWINDVPGWMFDTARIARPAGEELIATHAITLVAGFDVDAPRLTIRPKDFLGVDMRRLVDRLQESAMRAGAELRGGEHVQQIDHRAGEVVVTTGRGKFTARTLVDASGLTGIEALGKMHGTVRDVCAAAQEIYRIRDAREASAFFDRYRASEGDVTVFTGVAGGYSIVNVRRHDDRVFLLTGSVPADGVPSGKQLLDDFVGAHKWIGERERGGARAIPLSYARPTLVRGRLAAIGDAASQVFSAHGSGVGAGLVAARMVDDALARGDLGSYQRAWQKRYGLLFATNDLFRRLTQSLAPEELRAMIGEGVLGASTLEAELAQRFPPIDRSLLEAGRGLRKHPVLARKLVRVTAKIAQIAALYALVPEEGAKQDAWAERVHAAMR